MNAIADPRDFFATGYQVHRGQIASVSGTLVWPMSPQLAREVRKTHLASAKKHRADYRATRSHLDHYLWRASLTYAAELGRALRRTYANV